MNDIKFEAHGLFNHDFDMFGYKNDLYALK